MFNCHSDGILVYSDIQDLQENEEENGQNSFFPYLVKICNNAFEKLTNFDMKDFSVD